MTLFKQAIALLLTLSSWTVLADEIYKGKISFKFYDTEGVCVGTLLKNGSVLTNHHCILDEHGLPEKEIYFQMRTMAGASKYYELVTPEYIKLYDIKDVDNLTKDIILLQFKNESPSYPLEKAPVMGCKNSPYKLYTNASENGYCIVKEWDSGIYTTNNCIFEKGLSGTPMFDSKEKANICGMYSLTIKKSSNNGLGVAIKLKEE